MSALLAKKESRVASLLQRAQRDGSAWAAAVAASARRRSLPEPPPEAVHRLVGAAVGRLELCLAETREAQEVRRSCAERLRRLRPRRREARAALYDTLVRFRRVAGILTGEEIAADLFPPGDMPQSPTGLLTTARELLRKLELLAPGLEAPDSQALEFDVSSFSSFLGRQVSDLADAVVAIRQAERARSRAVKTRDRCLSRLGRVTSGAGKLFDGLSLLAR